MASEGTPQRAIDGDYIYFVTFNVLNRRWFFMTSEKASLFGQAVVTCCRIKNFELLGYCILPNHVHLLVRKFNNDEMDSQRGLGSLRCDEETLGNKNSYLYPQRRRPRRRSTEYSGYTLSHLMHSIKSTFSHALGHGRLWQHRSNFRIIESDAYLSNVVPYIRYNYRKMALPERFGQAPFVYLNDSAIERQLQ